MSSKFYNLSTDTTLGGNSPSDYTIPSEKAIKTYVDNNSGGGGGTLYDGQWVKSYSEIFNGSWAGATEKTFDLSSYLPNDNYIYEVLIGATATTGGTSGNAAYVTVYSSVLGDNISATGLIPVCRNITRTSYSTTCAGSITLPIGTNRILYGYSGTTTTSTVILWLFGYRRVGTNS